MRKCTFLVIFAILLSSPILNAQLLKISFEAGSASYPVALDSVWIENLTQPGDTVLHSPDTVIYMGTTGLHKIYNECDFFIKQNYPNPFSDFTTIEISLPEKSIVHIFVSNSIGKELIRSEYNLQKGLHSFNFTPGTETLYFLTVIYQDNVSSIKMISESSFRKQKCSIEHSGLLTNISELNYKTSSRGFVYTIGDVLRFVAYSGAGRDTIIDSPQISKHYIFDMPLGIHCPGLEYFNYGGKTYSTVLIGTKCWMAENLNIGTMLNANVNSSNDSVIEKYCYGNDPVNCDYYGGLYQWDEMMQYDTMPGGQGICPTGWHIPTDKEWKLLEGFVDTDFKPGDQEWDNHGFRGFDVGLLLKSTSGWNLNGNGLDIYNFTARPGGARGSSGNFYNLGECGDFWTSTYYNSADSYMRAISRSNDKSCRHYYGKTYAFSVRCVKN